MQSLHGHDFLTEAQLVYKKWIARFQWEEGVVGRHPPVLNGATGLAAHAEGICRRDMDMVSLADLLRNGFVYPPHSVFSGDKLATFGFFPHHDMQTTSEFRYRFREAGKLDKLDVDPVSLVNIYHDLLCQAVDRTTRTMRHPWLLQSAGKDSTTIAIALSHVRPDTPCITYLGGREENEVDSGRHIAVTLGLRHHTLECNPSRAYRRYLDIVHKMPLLTGDFALLSYVDLAWEIKDLGGDGLIDGMGSDGYFGAPAQRRKRLLYALASGLRLSPQLTEMPLVRRSFALCYLLGSVQMDPIERIFPGSRFTDEEVDALFGQPMSIQSRARLQLFQDELHSAQSHDELRVISMSIAGAAAGFAKGLYTSQVFDMAAAYPLCDHDLREWVYTCVPRHLHTDLRARLNKVLVRQHIHQRLGDLPYVKTKGSFRFDQRGLAVQCFDQVREFAVQAKPVLPGAVAWLDRNRGNFGNKYHASKFYLLAVVLPWILCRQTPSPARPAQVVSASARMEALLPTGVED